MADKKSSSVALDFTNVKEGGGNFNKKRQPEGDYKAKILKVQDSPAKGDGIMQWLFTLEVGTGVYPYYCKHQENQLWKIRNLFTAAGISIPKKRVNVDPNKVVGKVIGVTLEDDEYEGKLQSNIAATFPASELEGDDDEDTEDEAEVEDDAEEEVEVEADEDEEEVEEEADESDALDAADRATLKAYIKSEGLDIKVLKSMSDDDIRSAIRAAEDTADDAAEDDDELEEIEIEDV